MLKLVEFHVGTVFLYVGFWEAYVESHALEDPYLRLETQRFRWGSISFETYVLSR